MPSDSEVKRRIAEIQNLSGGRRFAQQLDLFNFLEEKKLRRPDIVVAHGIEMLENHASALGSKVWDLREKVFIAGLDSRQFQPKILDCLRALETRFPTSNRVRLLRGMLFESQTKFQKSLEIYNSIIQAMPGNIVARKRKVCLLKAQGNLDGSIKELNSYLALFSSDVQAWQELTQLYIETQRLPLAKFCVEELILLQPENHLYHTQYAEINYSLGDYDLARQHYAQALELGPEQNARVCLGFLQCLRAVASSNPVDRATYQHVLRQLQRSYAAAPEALRSMLTSTLQLPDADSAGARS